MPALGLTDHGVMNGAVEHYKACRDAGIKPILGLEAYFVDDRRAGAAPGTRVERNHLTLLAASDAGFRNLVKLSSAGFLEGFARGKANVDMELLDRHSEGVIALTGCLQSRFCQRLVEDRPDDARAHVDDLSASSAPTTSTSRSRRNGIPEQDRANEGIVRIARELGRPLVATADVHYLRREDYDNHAALLCVQTKSTLEQPKLSFDTNEFFLKSAEEMAAGVRGVAGVGRRRRSRSPSAARSRSSSASCCCRASRPPTARSRARCCGGWRWRGCARRYGDPLPAEARERLEFELGVIGEMGFDSYFLIVWDFVRYAKENGIAVGPGRGSAAGSIVAYGAQHHRPRSARQRPAVRALPQPGPQVDAGHRHRLLGPRPRAGDPLRRSEKYGRESVAQIITFGKMAPRAATRDAARVLGYDYATGDRVAKQIPEPIMGRSPSFDECLKDGQELRRTYDSDADARRIVDVAQGLEGIVRNNSIHAAAVVIADRPLDEIVPLQLAEDRGAPAQKGENGRPERSYKVVTQYSMGPIEEIGLLKMDFLGLRNLDVIEDAVEIIERSRERRDRDGVDPARRRQDLRDALPRRLGRRLPARVRGHARGAEADPPDRVQRHRRDRRALPAGRDALHPRLRARQARSGDGPLRRRAPAPDHRGDLRLLHLPGAADGDRQADRRLHPGRGRRPAQGGRQEEARPDGDDGGQVHRRLRGLRAPRRPSPRTSGR